MVPREDSKAVDNDTLSKGVPNALALPVFRFEV